MRRRTQLPWLLAGLAALACTARDAGSFSVTFTWEEPPEGAVWIRARVEERGGDASVAGPILASAGPARFVYGGQVDLVMGSVPNGDDRVVVVEVREGESAGLPVLWYGLSEPFSLRAGDDTAVEVALTLKRPEAEALEATVALRWGGVAREVVRPTELASAGVLTRSTGAQAVVLANDASFSAGLVTVELTTGEGVACTDEAEGEVTWRACTVEAWDLSAGLPTAGDDGQYTLFAKFVDRYGYESGVKKATVQVDGTAPQVLTAALTTGLAKAGDAVVLTVTAHEAPGDGAGGAVLAVTPAGGVVFAGPTRVGTTNTVQWVATIGGEPDANAYTFAVTLADALGNEGAVTALVDDGGAPLELRVDVTPPALASTAIVLEKDGEAAAEGEGVVFGLPATGSEVSGTVSFAFALREENAGDGLPVVRLSGLALGAVTREPSLDDADAREMGYRFACDVRPGDWGAIESDVDLEVTAEDAAGNRAALSLAGLASSLRFDFVRPTADQCLVLPDFIAKATETVTYVVVASEPLAEEPDLGLEGNVEPMFEAPAQVSAGDRRWAWEQPARDLVTESVVLSASLVDRAGNASEAPVCELEAWLDGVPPELFAVAVTTKPEVRDASGQVVRVAGPGSVIEVEVLVIEAQEMLPLFFFVTLDGPFQKLLEADVFDGVDDTWWWEGAYTVDPALQEQLEGLRVVHADVEDGAGNPAYEGLENDVEVRIDYTAPGLECVLSRDALRPGDGVTLTVTASEAVRPADVRVATPEGGVTLAYDEAQSRPTASPPKLVFTGGATTQAASGAFRFEVRAADLVGNESPTPACGGGGYVDGDAPRLVGGAGDAPSPTVFGLEDAAHPERNRLTLSFALEEPHAPELPATGECPEASGCPRVRLGERSPGVLRRAPELDDAATGRWGFAYEAELTSATWGAVEEEPTLTLFWQDALGNALATDFGTVKLDFVPPALELTVDPADRPARRGETVTFTLNDITGDDLAAGSATLGVEPPVEGLVGPVVSGAVVRWTYVVRSTDDGPVGLTAGARDEEGNAATVSATASLDGRAPSPPLVATSRPGCQGDACDRFGAMPGFDEMTVTVTADEVPAAVRVTVEGSPPSGGCGPGPTGKVFQCRHAVTGLPGQGRAVTVLAFVEDVAGNAASGSHTVHYDFDPPVLVGTPYFERDDRYARARVAANDLHAKNGTTVTASFAVDEPLAEEPVVRVGDLSRTPAAFQAGDTFVVVDLPYPGQEGLVVPTAEVVDRAGNAAGLPLGTLRCDATPPEPVGPETQGGIELYLAPWGAHETAGQALGEVRACPAPEGSPEEWGGCDRSSRAPFEPGALVVVYKTTHASGHPACTTTILGEAEADGQGGVALAVPPVVPSVCVGSVDRAGNASPVALVERGEWLGTLAGKVVGSTVENPHAVSVVPAVGRSLRQPFAFEEGPATAGVGALDGVPTHVAAEWSWTRRTVDGVSPVDAHLGALVYEAERGDALLAVNDWVHDETRLWRWDGRAWALVRPTGEAPPSLLDAAVVHDVRGSRTLLFGGDRGYVTDDLWAFDGERWSKVEVDGERPAARLLAGSVYDGSRGRVLLLGGLSADWEPLQDVWELRGDTWRRLEPGEGPGSPGGKPLAFDPVRGRAVLQEGGTTWELDGDVWHRTAFGSGKAPEACQAMAYVAWLEASLCTELAFDAEGSHLALWAWDGLSWRLLEPGWQLPTHLSSGWLVSDLEDGVVVFFGESETWILDGWGWSHATPSTLAPTHAYEGARLAWDGGSGRVLLAGASRADDHHTPDGRVWALNNWRWEDLSPPAGGPGARYAPGLVHDPVRGAVLLGFGWAPGPGGDGRTLLDDLWAWDGAGWSELSAALPPQTTMAEPVAFFDPTTDGVVFYDADAGYHVLAGDDAWTERTVAGPTPSALHPAAFHPSLATLATVEPEALWLLGPEGGWQAFDDGSVGRFDAVAAIHDGTRRRVWFQGSEERADWTYDEVLAEWAGGPGLHRTAYARLTPPILAPGPATCDERRHKLLFVQSTQNAGVADLVECDVDPDSRSGLLFSFDVAAFVSRGAGVEAIELRATAGGRGYGLDTVADDDGDLLGEAVEGVELRAWDAQRGEWVTTARFAGPAPESMADVIWQSPTDAEAARIVSTGREPRLNVLVQPLEGSGNGPATAEVAVDALEARVRYRWPGP